MSAGVVASVCPEMEFVRKNERCFCKKVPEDDEPFFEWRVEIRANGRIHTVIFEEYKDAKTILRPAAIGLRQHHAH